MTKKHDRTISHLRNDRFCDTIGREDWSHLQKTRRLTLFGVHDFPDAWRYLAELAPSQPGHRVTYFPVTNVVIKDEAKDFWLAMRLFYLEHSVSRIAITDYVFEEIRQWMMEPFRNADLANSLRNALGGLNPWAFHLPLRQNDAYTHFVAGYTRLLGCRRTLLDDAQLGTFTGSPMGKSDAMEWVRTNCGERGQLIAKKGSVGPQNATPYKPFDEGHVMQAILYGLSTGNEIMIVTADEDTLECFHKAQYLLDTHYRAMLAGDIIAAGRWPTQPTSWRDVNRRAFNGDIELYPHPSPSLREVLPTAFTPVDISCIYIMPNGSGTQMSFRFETEMMQLVRTKISTQGLSSEKFGDRNVHVDLSPIEGIGGNIGIGKDLYQEVKGWKFRIAMLDFILTVPSEERHGKPL